MFESSKQFWDFIILAMVDDSSLQRMSRLTPLKAVLELIDAQVEAVEPQRWAIASTYGYTLAEDVVASACPDHAIALRDGFAVAAASVADAGSYVPVPLSQPACRIDVGQPLPSGTDAVLPLDAVVLRGAHAEAVAPVTVGEGVLPAGGDIARDTVLRATGDRMRSVDIAAMHAAGIRHASIRAPRVAVALGGEPGTRPLHAALGFAIRAIADAGATVSGNRDISFEGAVADKQNDAIVAVGSTGSGQSDTAVQKLARCGRVAMHGIAIAPGETAAFGFIETRPVLLVPGRIDAALTVWLLIGRHLVAKLVAGKVEDAPVMMPLKRKVTSTIGMTELVPVRAAGDVAEPLASGYLSFESLARSDGWIIVPAESEGFAEGTPVAVRRWS